MTIGEFKAFLDGMNLDKAPTPEEWVRILEKVDTLAEPVSFPFSPAEPAPLPDPREFWADPLAPARKFGSDHPWHTYPYTVTC